jgi:predicted nucleic acid-binding protein
VYILDTDVLAYYLDAPNEYPHLRDNIQDADAKGLLCTSIITVEEMVIGAVVELRKKEYQNGDEIVQQYYYLFELIRDLQRFIVLPFDKRAYDAYQRIPQRVIDNTGTNDCRIAAIALSRDFTVVTNNGKHFSRIEAATSVKVKYWVNTPLQSP